MEEYQKMLEEEIPYIRFDETTGQLTRGLDKSKLEVAPLPEGSTILLTRVLLSQVLDKEQDIVDTNKPCTPIDVRSFMLNKAKKASSIPSKVPRGMNAEEKKWVEGMTKKEFGRNLCPA